MQTLFLLKTKPVSAKIKLIGLRIFGVVDAYKTNI
jgi:hypothetical protein